MPGGAGFQYQQSGYSGTPPKPGSGGYDGPPSTTDGPQQRGPNPFGGVKPLGYDPAKPPTKEKVIPMNLELPAAAYALENDFDFGAQTQFPGRPEGTRLGKPVTIRVNQFKVTQWPQDDIYQYDINWGQDPPAGKIMALWKCPKVQAKIKEYTQNQGPFIWDGNKIGWSKIRMPAFTIEVNLDEYKPKSKYPPNPNSKKRAGDLCRVQFRPSKMIRMAIIGAYLNRQIPFDNGLLEAINFLDHIMRQSPSEKFTAIKRSFFSNGNVARCLDDCITALKGCYSSMRLCRVPNLGQPPAPGQSPATGLGINVDVSNGTFWTTQDLHQCARNYLKQRNPNKDYNKMIEILKPVKDFKKNCFTMSDDFKNLRKLTKLRFTVKHRAKGDDFKTYAISNFTWSAEPKYNKDGMNAKNTLFKWKNPKKKFIEEEISVYNYFKEIYNITLQYWQLPLVCTTKKGMFPMELCTLISHQRYMYKLSPDQTAAMIKFAVTRPKDRLESIKHGTDMLKWSEDRYLQYFGLRVDPNMTQTKALLIPAPDIQFGGTKFNPGTAGRWDLRGKKFVGTNPAPLKSWGFVVFENCVPEAALQNFINVFVTTYSGHGGNISNKKPAIYYQQNKEQEMDDIIRLARRKIGDQAQANPQIMFFVMKDKDSEKYARLKKNMDCRWGMVSQCLNVAHVRNAQGQYCSNVAMKVNAKLGGTTSRAIAPKGVDSYFNGLTMIIGADVSHASPGSKQQSMAAITCSMDAAACRYAAAVETNGERVEMITKVNLKAMLVPLFSNFCRMANGCPQHIYYFRDGVSEGQFAHVLNQELAHMKEVLLEAYEDPSRKALIQAIKWTVVVCTKRHHIRFFPNDSTAGDKNGNPLPGVLVEQDITHPFEYDFYLNSHAAIQGTSRPVHYQVIRDERGVPPHIFQTMVYHHCYQYMRSTTPVSLHPAVYYAHLASNRAKSHENRPSSDGPRAGQKFEEDLQDRAVAAANARMGNNPNAPDATTLTGSNNAYIEGPLIPMGNTEGNGPDAVAIRTAMWYI